MSRRFIHKTDAVVILLAAALAVAGWLLYSGAPDGGMARAEIYVDGQLIKVVDLSEGGASVFAIPGAPAVVIRSDGGGILFESSDCPDQVCVHTGRISRPGAFAACLPNKVLIQIVSADVPNAYEPDVIVR
ncbi:MAG: NusG domain II-containing protein [Oscillospiraceae bacterium]|nr:NusG domain II-containing protein [Oscillospiraceae bacterium]